MDLSFSIVSLLARSFEESASVSDKTLALCEAIASECEASADFRAEVSEAIEQAWGGK